jgi:hypothetical protein
MVGIYNVYRNPAGDEIHLLVNEPESDPRTPPGYTYHHSYSQDLETGGEHCQRRVLSADYLTYLQTL